MSEPRFSWTQPCCDKCWEEAFPARGPVRMRPGWRAREQCVYCGEDTRSGIYVRIDPAEANYPSRLK